MDNLEIDVELCKQLAMDAHEGQTRRNGPSWICQPTPRQKAKYAAALQALAGVV